MDDFIKFSDECVNENEQILKFYKDNFQEMFLLDFEVIGKYLIKKNTEDYNKDVPVDFSDYFDCGMFSLLY